MQDLSDDIIFDILSRLPVVSLCRFKCVSKSWRFIISNPSFIKTHLHRDKHERLILCEYSNYYSVELDSSRFGHQSVALRLKFARHRKVRNPIYRVGFCCSCDGLVLMLDSRFHCFLVNPSTRQSRELPEFPFTNKRKVFAGYGLGYDSSTYDYKIVHISCYVGETNNNNNNNVVGVYAIKTNSWRRIESSPYDHSRSEHRSGALVCGALHWVASDGTNDVIVALDLAVEKFRTVPSPTRGCYIGDRLCVLGGCLCVFVQQYSYNRCVLDVWVMKEYGVRDSWTKFIVPYGFGNWRPLSLSRTGQVLFNVGGYTLVIFDPSEEGFKELVVRGCPALFEVGTYVESLVSP